MKWTLFSLELPFRNCIFLISRNSPQWARASLFMRFLDDTQRHITVGRTHLDECSARRRDLYLTTHNTHYRQTSILPVRFEPTVSAGERPQTYASDRAATGTGQELHYYAKIDILLWNGLQMGKSTFHFCDTYEFWMSRHGYNSLLE